MDISADVGTQRQTLLINQGQSNLNKRTYSFIRDLRYNKLWAENGSTDFYMYGYISWCGNSETDVTNKPRSIKGKVELGHSFNWTCHLIFDKKPFGNVLEWIEKKRKEENKWMNCIRCDQRFE